MRALYAVSLGLTFATALSVAPATAEPFTWEFSGHVTEHYRRNYLTDVLPLGSIVMFRATFDDSSPDLCGTSGGGFYWLPGGTVSFNGDTYLSSRNALEVNAPQGACYATADRPQDATVRFLDFVGASSLHAAVGWIGGPDVGDAMPSQLPNLLGAHFLIGASGDCTLCYGIQGQITAVHIVPEPTTLVMTTTGAVMLWKRRRQRRTS